MGTKHHLILYLFLHLQFLSHGRIIRGVVELDYDDTLVSEDMPFWDRKSTMDKNVGKNQRKLMEESEFWERELTMSTGVGKGNRKLAEDSNFWERQLIMSSKNDGKRAV